MSNRFAVGPLTAIVTLMMSSGIALGYYTAPAVATPQMTPTPVVDATPQVGATPAAVATPLPSTPTPVPGTVLASGTPVSVSLVQSISSSSAQKGQTVGIIVTKEVDASGMIVVARGATGQATVADVARAGGNGHAGKLALNIDWIRSVDGGKIALTTVDHTTDGGSAKDEARGATVAGYLLFGPVGLFAHNFVHGKDVTVGTDQVFKVFVDHTVHVASTQPAEDPTAGFDH